MRYDLESTLPERAFKKSLFKNAPATLEGGGKGGGGTPAPTTATSYQTNIPEYAQPYVENMLNATQSQLFNTDDSGITGFKPYTPYSSNPSDYYAGFSPLQQQAQSDAANLQTPGQFGQATDMATMSGLGALGTTGQAGMYGGMGARSGQQAAGLSNMYGGLGAQSGQQLAGLSNAYGGLGAMAGQQGANIGQSLGQMSQDPNAVQSYMNPYLQASLNPQLAETQRQYDITGQQEQGAATQSGAFGGSREALMAAENQRNANLAKNQIIGQGYNNAFQNAQQQMQASNQAALAGNQQALSGYGMGLQGAGQAGQQALAGYGMGLQGAGQAGQMGMQGAQAGLAGVGAQQAGYGQAGQAASNLANIGGQQLNAQQGIIGTQAQQGALQQAQQQSIINQAVQDYGTAQQYPMMQLGLMSNMLRGLPMQSTAVQSYQAQAPVAQQAAGLLGAYNAYTGKKEGGTIRAMAKGGIADAIPGYKSGVLARVENSIDDIAQSDTYAQPGEKQLPKLMQQTQSPGIKQLIATKQAEDQLGQNMSGVAAGDTGDLGMNMAEGGIIPRFAGKDTSEVKDPTADLDAMTKKAMAGYETPEAAFGTQQGLRANALENLEKTLSPEEVAYKAANAARQKELPEKQRRAERTNEALAWLEAGSTVGGLGAAAIAGGKKYMLGQADINKTYEDLNDTLAKQAAEMKKAQRAEASGNADKAELYSEKATALGLKAAETKATLANAVKTTQMTTESHERVAKINAAVQNAPTALLKEQLQRYEREMTAENAAKGLPPPTLEDIQKRMTGATKGYDTTQNTAIAGKAETALNDWIKLQALNPEWFKLSEDEKNKRIDDQYNKIVKRQRNTVGAGTQVEPPAQNNSLIMDGYAFPDQKSLDAYKAAKANKGK